jgi:large subunit ribosomal protein L30
MKATDSMITVIRIRGDVGLDHDVRETFHRLNLRKKYSCILIEKPNAEQMGMIKRVKDSVAFGEISPETHKKLIEARGKFSKSKTHFRLHPPRKGIESKKHFGVGRGVLGNHGKDIDKLIERML